MPGRYYLVLDQSKGDEGFCEHQSLARRHQFGYDSHHEKVELTERQNIKTL